MNRTFMTLACAAVLCAASNSAAADPITLIGTGRLSATAKDGLKLTPELLEDGVTPHDQVGGFGSAITYTGVGNLYLATPDRGPADGATTYQDRYYLLSIEVTPGDAAPVALEVEEATLLTDEDARVFTGSVLAFEDGLRFDPEGVRLDGFGGFFVSDEYGPALYRFSADGVRIDTFNLPEKFAVETRGTEDQELPPANVSGRQPNRGMEGLAISPDSRRLYGIMQNALIQDGALDAENKRVGLNNRLLQIDRRNERSRELVYTLSSAKNGVNEILAINDHELLVLERDGEAGAEAGFKQIFKVDVNDATDVSDIDALPTADLPADVVAVKKTPFLDLLAPSFGLVGESFPEKVEGLSFGPRLADGRLLLLVTTDNDFELMQDSLVWAFAIEPDALEFEPQTLRVPVTVVEFDGNRATTTVELMGQALLPVDAIDIASVRFAGAAVQGDDGPASCAASDLNGDSLADLSCVFANAELEADPASDDAVLTAETTTGTPLRGRR